MLVEAAATARRGEGTETRPGEMTLRTQDEVDPRRHDDVAGPGPQLLAREVQGVQGRRASRVDGHAGATEPERVGDPASGRVGHVARVGVGIVCVAEVAPHLAVVVVVDGDEDSDALVRTDGARVHPRVLECLPGELQQQPLLRVDVDGLDRGNVEESRVELLDIRQVATLRGGDLTGVEAAVRPSSRRNGTDHVDPLIQDRPQLLQGADVAGEPEGHADYRDGFRAGGGQTVTAVDRPGLSGGDLGASIRLQRSVHLAEQRVHLRVIDDARAFERDSEVLLQSHLQTDKLHRVESHVEQTNVPHRGVEAREVGAVRPAHAVDDVPEHGLDQLVTGRRQFFRGIAGRLHSLSLV